MTHPDPHAIATARVEPTLATPEPRRLPETPEDLTDEERELAAALIRLNGLFEDVRRAALANTAADRKAS